MTLLELAKTCPDINVTVRLGDLLDANERLARKVREEVEAEAAARREEFGDHLVPEREAIKALGGPDPSTLWRWEKKGYLQKVKIGNRSYYKEGDLKRIINNNTVINS